MKFPDPIAHFKSHLTKEQLEQMRNTALSAAGFSAGIIILLAQTKGQPSYSTVSLWAAIASLLIWLFGALYVGAYLFHGERTYGHLNVALAAIVSSLGYPALFVSVVATVWRLSPCAGVLLTILGVVLAVCIFKHFQSVDRYCNETDT
jgi:hypothetical protein